MPSKNPEDLDAFVRQLDAATLASVLMALAADHAAVHERLLRLQLSNHPKALATVFRKKLAAWRRSTRDVSYEHANDFGHELEAWLQQVERELMPRDPAEALALAEAFLQSDAAFFERVDDSGGAVGDAMCAACVLWLKAASHCETPEGAWPDRIAALVATDEYGAREDLLRRADLLLSEPALRGLVSSCEAKLDAAMETSPKESERMSWPALRASAALALLAEALRDPRVLERATLRHSPSPNPVQRSALAEAFLKYDQPEGALPWLEGSWGHMEASRQHLRARALEALGRSGEAAAERRQLFEATLAVPDLHAWLDLLPTHEQAAAIEHVRALASAHADPVTVALLLLDIGDAVAAEASLASHPDRIRGRDYGTLLPLAEILHREGRSTGATLVYRALLAAILDRAYAPAYHHAARYWSRLVASALSFSASTNLESPGAFEARIRAQHKRKAGFWAHVDAARQGDA